MKQLLTIGCLLGVLSGCQSTDQTATNSIDSAQVRVGGDLDEHGCKGSAGYAWSVVKNDCIRVFEAGVRLDAADSTLDQTFSALVVFADDEKENEVEAELFLPSENSLLPHLPHPIFTNTGIEATIGEYGQDCFLLLF